MLACFISMYNNMQGFHAVDFVRSKRGAIATKEQVFFLSSFFFLKLFLNELM